jgi:UDP-3-O-[3-hydroxymyristoyl] glucosamine N-acyltransferase
MGSGMILKKIISLPSKVFIKVKNNRFRKKFKYIAKTSGFGKLGYGDGCSINGYKNIRIGENTWFGSESEIIADRCNALIIGNHVQVTSRCRIDCAGNIQIADNVLIAPDVSITDYDGIEHFWEKNKKSDVVIQEGVWLGQRVSVLPGVTIGAHSIVGANSVVMHDIPDFCIAGGVPAEVIKRWNFEKNEWERI